ncbi:hypothetical protein LT337_00540 [Mycolicibacterium fortuitum]|nr:hypothetical protein LT337_00540 [Mycolicibacterium fortuitum]
MSYPPPPHFPPQLPPQPPPRRHTTTALTRTLGVLSLVVLVGGYAAAVLLTRHIWDDREATRITYATVTSDGAPASADALVKVRDVVEKRLYGIGFSGSEVKIDNDTVVVTVPSRDPDTVRDIAMPGQLTIRPVVHAMAAKTGPRPRHPPRGPPNPFQHKGFPTRRSCGRAPTRRSRSWHCSTRPPAVAMRMHSPATTTPTCHWSPAPPTDKPSTC